MSSTSTTKTCTLCKRLLNLEEFSTKTNGHPFSWCRPCNRQYHREHYRKIDIEKSKEKSKKYRPKCQTTDSECGVIPTFGLVGDKPRWCFKHKPENAVHVNSAGKDITKKQAERMKERGALLSTLKRSWYLEFRAKQKCKYCGLDDPHVLEFHHIDPTTKIQKINQMHSSTGYTMQKLQEEIEKCIPLCRNCHTSVTQDALNSYKSVYMREKSIENIRTPKHRFMIDYYVKNPCVYCGCADLRCLECDHVDPKTKTGKIGYLLASASLESLKKELEKCQVLCGNCHRRKTNAECESKKRKREVFE